MLPKVPFRQRKNRIVISFTITLVRNYINTNSTNLPSASMAYRSFGFTPSEQSVAIALAIVEEQSKVPVDEGLFSDALGTTSIYLIAKEMHRFKTQHGLYSPFISDRKTYAEAVDTAGEDYTEKNSPGVPEMNIEEEDNFDRQAEPTKTVTSPEELIRPIAVEAIVDLTNTSTPEAQSDVETDNEEASSSRVNITAEEEPAATPGEVIIKISALSILELQLDEETINQGVELIEFVVESEEHPGSVLEDNTVMAKDDVDTVTKCTK
jgi:hypothetical protein